MNALGLPTDMAPMLAEHVASLKAVPDPPSLIDLRRRVAAMVPRVDLPELMLEVMSWHPGFTEAFTHTSGNPARVGDLGLSVVAVLCALRHEGSVPDVGEAGHPGCVGFDTAGRTTDLGP